jgi:hypothetical protein
MVVFESTNGTYRDLQRRRKRLRSTEQQEARVAYAGDLFWGAAPPF